MLRARGQGGEEKEEEKKGRKGPLFAEAQHDALK